MFGSKNKENLEKIESLSKELERKDDLFTAVAESSNLMESNVQEYENSTIQMKNDLDQIAENLDASGAILSENAKLINALHETMSVAATTAEEWDASQTSFLNKLDKISENSLKAVDNNKHFTDPSKSLSEIADSMKKEYMDNIRNLKTMEDYAKQMSVLSLNAAIDAGRMGESGVQFVASAEAIRNYASNYDQSVKDLMEKFEASQKQIAVMEENIRTLINLLKENNVAVSKIMKDLNALSKEGKKMQETAPIGAYRQLIDTAGLIKDAETEVERMEARNRLQIDDILSEVQLQKKEVRELSECMTELIAKTK